MTQRKTTFQRELPVSGIKPHILVMDDTEKDDIPEGAASFRYQTTYLGMDDTEKDDIPEGAASFRYQTTYPSDGQHQARRHSRGSCQFQVSNHRS
jgi:hypothetical protein